MPPAIWVVSELYWPEETSTGYFLACLAEALTSEAPVSVLCGQPKYDRRGERAPTREMRNGVSIHRCAGTMLDKNVIAFRVVNILTITLSMLLNAVARFRRGEIIMVATNPPVLPFFMALACRLRGAHPVLLVQDVYPDTMVAAGLAAPDGFTTRVLNALNRWLYRSMQRISVLGRDMAALVRKKLGDGTAPDHVVIIRNWADVEDVTPGDRASNPMLGELGLLDKFVVQYAGNMGPVHGIETIVEAARLLRRTEPRVHFLFIGGGGKRKWLEDTVIVEGLDNITLVGSRARSEQQVFLNACDVTVSAFVPGMSGVGVPSRMYNIMAAGKPMVAAVDRDSEQAMVIREEDVGWVVPPNDAKGMAAAIREAHRDRTKLAAMGRRAREAAQRQYTFARVLEEYRALIRDLDHGARG